MQRLKRLLQRVHAKERHQESTAGGCQEFLFLRSYHLENFINTRRIMLTCFWLIKHFHLYHCLLPPAGSVDC